MLIHDKQLRNSLGKKGKQKENIIASKNIFPEWENLLEETLNLS